MTSWHLTQLNVAHLRAPIDDPQIADFVAMLDPINALAEASPGYVWRLQTEEGNATSVALDGDPLFIPNLTVWTDAESLADFVYRSAHKDIMRRRREFFESPVEAYLVCWWVPAGTVPTVDEAMARLARLQADGPTPEAFTLRHRFDPPGSGTDAVRDDTAVCPA